MVDLQNKTAGSLEEKIIRLREQSRHLVRRLMEMDGQIDPEKRAATVKAIAERMRTLSTALRCLGALEKPAAAGQ